jgi:hypothetical protein
MTTMMFRPFARVGRMRALDHNSCILEDFSWYFSLVQSHHVHEFKHSTPYKCSRPCPAFKRHVQRVKAFLTYIAEAFGG